jgi:hypothetical protein
MLKLSLPKSALHACVCGCDNIQEHADAVLTLRATSRTTEKATRARSRFAILSAKTNRQATVEIINMIFITEYTPREHTIFLSN